MSQWIFWSKIVNTVTVMKIMNVDLGSCAQQSNSKAIHWRHNLFKIHSGNYGNAFIKELIRLFRACTEPIKNHIEICFSSCYTSFTKACSKIKQKNTLYIHQTQTMADGSFQQFFDERRLIQLRIKNQKKMFC